MPNQNKPAITLNSFPNEIIQYIFTFLETENLGRVKQVCKQFYLLANNEKIQEVCFKNSLENNLREPLAQQFKRNLKELEVVINVTHDQLEKEESQEDKDIDKYIEIIVNDLQANKDPRKISKTYKYFSEVKNTTEKVITTKNRLLSSRYGFFALISGFSLLFLGGFIGLVRQNKTYFSNTASTLIDVGFTINLFVFFIGILAMVINRYYENKLVETQTHIKTLDEKSPLLKQGSFFNTKAPEKQRIEEDTTNATETMANNDKSNNQH